MEARKLNAAEMVAVLLVIVGGLNWLLVGVFNYNLVTGIFGDGSLIARTVFVLVGLSAVWLLAFGTKLRRS